MRFYELIFEGPNAYLPLFNGLNIDKGQLITHIRQVEDALKRQDRVQWFLKWSRLWMAYKTENTDHPVDEKLLNRWENAVTHQYGLPSEKRAEAQEVVAELSDYKHYVDMAHVATIQSLVWDKQSPYGLKSRLWDLQDEYQESIKNNERIVKQRGTDEVVIDFKNGWVWFNLNRGGCREEADAMGHCGNGAGGAGETILSLRKFVHDTYWEPALTFILDRDGELGEMKGRGNDKPTARYHDMIVALLRHPLIKGIKGGGYMPENNFSTDDLPRDVKKALLAEKPALKELADVYSDWAYARHKNDTALADTLFPLMEKKLRTKLDSWEYEEVDYEKRDIIIKRWDKVENYANENRYSHFAAKVYDFLDAQGGDVELMLEENTELHSSDATRIAAAVDADYKMPLFREMIGRGVDYKLEGAHLQSDGTTVEAVVSISDFVDDETQQLGNMSSLLEEREHGHWMDKSDLEADDDLGYTILEYLFVGGGPKQDKLKKTLVGMLEDKYRRVERFAPRSDDPNQLDMGF